MKAVRHPGSTEARLARLAALEARVRTLQSQLDASKIELERLRSLRDDTAWTRGG